MSTKRARLPRSRIILGWLALARSIRSTLTLKLGLGIGIPSLMVLLTTWLLLIGAQEGMTRLAQVVRLNAVSGQTRDLSPEVVRLLAYTQMVSDGDLTYVEDLKRQLLAVDVGLQRLAALAAALPPEQQQQFIRAQEHWRTARDLTGELLRAEAFEPLQRGAVRMDGVSAALADLQHTLEDMAADALGELDAQTAAAARWPAKFRLLSGLLVYCVAALVVLTAIVLRITVFKPVRKLQRAARAIARGRFAHRIEHASGDEFGEFAEAFNSMADSLQHRRERSS